MRLSRRELLGAAACAGMGTLICAQRGKAQECSQESTAGYARRIRIAVVQQESIPGAVEANREKALGFARQALKGGADVIQFHEALLTGYTENVRDLAEEKNGPTTKAFQEVLRGSDAMVLYGLVERDGADCYTSAILVGANGVVAAYRKTHLWWKAKGVRCEPAFFKPGNELVTFDVRGWKCGVMICYDGDFPEMTRAYANRDCVALFWLNNRNSRGKDEVLPLARGNSMIMATSCCCGRNDTEKSYAGGSNIVNYNGAVLEEIWDKEGVICADVDPSGVMAARDQNPGYHGRRPELYR